MTSEEFQNRRSHWLKCVTIASNGLCDTDLYPSCLNKVLTMAMVHCVKDDLFLVVYLVKKNAMETSLSLNICMCRPFTHAFSRLATIMCRDTTLY